MDLSRWIAENSGAGAVWFAKRLAANDTLATKAHQAGPYIPKRFLFERFPALDRTDVKNPDIRFDLHVDSHGDRRKVRAIYYNGRRFGDGTRDETRLTNFGGKGSPLLDPDSTGALAVFAFAPAIAGGGPACRVWLCTDAVEDGLVEDLIGPVEPGAFVTWSPDAGRAVDLFAEPARADCRLSAADIPPEWLRRFPAGDEIVRKSVTMRRDARLGPDARLVRRRRCEFEIFQSVESAFYAPRIRGPFGSIEPFLALAQTLLQSRKARSGKSLELHAREIFVEEGLAAGADFDHGPVIENGKRPDFVFPSRAAYEDPAFPPDRLRMLAVKTTCRDRWRQILNEADRIPRKDLLTLQEGVSENQFREMSAAGVRLVVPSGLHEAYPKAVRPRLTTLEAFIGEVRSLSGR